MARLAPHPVQTLRTLLLAMERRVTQEAADGAVEGAFESVRRELPALDQALASVVSEITAAATEARSRLSEPALSRSTQDLSAAITHGALDALREDWSANGAPWDGLQGRLDELSRRVSEFVEARSLRDRRPGFRARAAARGMVHGATTGLRESAPQLSEDLAQFAPVLEDLASHVGRGLVGGMAAGLERELREGPSIKALRSTLTELGNGVRSLVSPALKLGAACVGTVAVSASLVRWARAR